MDLSSKNQKVLKTQMRNQFNIDLNYFNMNDDDPNCKNKISLKLVRTSIIESLYQEIDNLQVSVRLNSILKQPPGVQIDENIQ